MQVTDTGEKYILLQKIIELVPKGKALSMQGRWAEVIEVVAECEPLVERLRQIDPDLKTSSMGPTLARVRGLAEEMLRQQTQNRGQRHDTRYRY